MSKRTLWERPTLHFEEETAEHRKVTWLELFFDLFFVVSIAQLTHALSEHPFWPGLGSFAALFIPIWWVWIGFTYYNERFESLGLENRVFTFALMVPVIGLAAFAHHGLGETFRGFVLSYAFARIILTALWLRATIHVHEFRPTGLRFVVGFGLSVALTLVAAFADAPMRYVVFGVALAIDVLTPFTTVAQQAKLPRFSSSKLPERFGLFVIIVLGEMVVGIVNGVAALEDVSRLLFVDAALGVALGLGMWWIYFDFIGRRPPKSGTGWAFAWGYLHLPLVMTIAATGAGVANVIGHEGLLSEEVRQLIAHSVGGALIVMACLETTLHREEDEPTHPNLSPTLKLFGALLALGVGLTPLTDPIALMLMLLGVLLIQMVYGAWVWFTQELEEGETEIGD